MSGSDPFDIKALRINPKDPKLVPASRAVMSTRIRKRQQHFVKIPWTWLEKLRGSSGHTYHVALFLLYLHWQRGDHGPLKLASGVLAMDGVSPASKLRAVHKLENLGLITVEWRLKKSPRVWLHLLQE